MDINKLWKNAQNARFIKVSGDPFVVNRNCRYHFPYPHIKLFFPGMNQLHFLDQVTSPGVFIDDK
jgi:hypothetical protein